MPQVLAQVNRDPEVMDRYRRHFHMTSVEVNKYISGLRPGHLKSSQVLRVYSVPNDGHIKMHTQSYPIGTPVYVDWIGKPVMIVKCGNPIAEGPKNPTLINEEAMGRVNSPDLVLKDLEGSEATTPMLEQVISLEQPDFPEYVASPVEVPPETVGSSPIPIVAAGFPNLIPLLLGLGGAGAVISTVHTGGNGTTTVPEPATLAIIGVGVIGLLARRRK